MDLNNKRKVQFLYCFVIAILFLSIGSCCSWLYSTNSWVDSNCFFTVGKSMLKGKILYRDIYEQKGPVLYFIHAIAALISNNNFFGVFILEIIFFSGYLFFSLRLGEEYVSNAKLLYLIPPMISMIILVSRAFGMGDSAEEFSFVFVAYTLYTIIYVQHRNRTLTALEAFCIGVSAAMVLWIKYTILGFFIVVAIYIVMYTIKIDSRRLIKICEFGLLGCVIITIPILVYFGVNHALNDLWIGYFYNNLFLYPGEVAENHLILIARILVGVLINNKVFALFLCGGIVWVYLTGKNDRIILSFSFAGLLLGVYWGGRTYPYYALILFVYSIFGIIAFLRCFEKIKIKKDNIWMIFGTIIMFLIVCLWGNNIPRMKIKREELPQYQFAEIINKKKKPTLLNYGFLDGGFYLAADIVPNSKYFCTLNIPLKDMYDTQAEEIAGGKFDFIITRTEKLDEYNVEWKKYSCICSAKYVSENENMVYYLYERKDGEGRKQ